MSYSYATFRDYLQYEILQSTASLMGWEDTPGPLYEAVGTVFYPTSLTGPRSAQGVYDAITNEVLLQMGFSTPEEVPDERILEMRSLGRIEAWRAVVFNTMADTTMDFGDSFAKREEANSRAHEQLGMAESDHNKLFGPSPTNIRSERATTHSAPVSVRW